MRTKFTSTAALTFLTAPYLRCGNWTPVTCKTWIVRSPKSGPNASGASLHKPVKSLVQSHITPLLCSKSKCSSSVATITRWRFKKMSKRLVTLRYSALILKHSRGRSLRQEVTLCSREMSIRLCWMRHQRAWSSLVGSKRANALIQLQFITWRRMCGRKSAIQMESCCQVRGLGIPQWLTRGTCMCLGAKAMSLSNWMTCGNSICRRIRGRRHL